MWVKAFFYESGEIVRSIPGLGSVYIHSVQNSEIKRKIVGHLTSLDLQCHVCPENT